MIDQVFQHCSGIGPVCEGRLKEGGFISWDDCFTRSDELPLGPKKRKQFIGDLKKSSLALKEKNISFLLKSFPSKEHWRILSEYFNEATFFDIEISDLSWYESFPTVIAAYRNGTFYHFTWKDNLDEFLDFLDECKLLVSFNGVSFDAPYLQNYFNIPPIEVPHVDLRWIAYHQGYRGGLKSIEKQLRVHRPESIGDVDGFEAVHLFHQWNRGKEEAGKELIQYCRCDVAATFLCAMKLLMKIHGLDKDINIQPIYDRAMDISYMIFLD